MEELKRMQMELDRRTAIEDEAIRLISECRFREADRLLDSCRVLQHPGDKNAVSGFLTNLPREKGYADVTQNQDKEYALNAYKNL